MHLRLGCCKYFWLFSCFFGYIHEIHRIIAMKHLRLYMFRVTMNVGKWENSYEIKKDNCSIASMYVRNGNGRTTVFPNESEGKWKYLVCWTRIAKDFADESNKQRGIERLSTSKTSQQGQSVKKCQCFYRQ